MEGKFFLWEPDAKLGKWYEPCVLEQLPGGGVNIYLLDGKDSPFWYAQNGTLTPLVPPAGPAGLTEDSKPDTMTP